MADETSDTARLEQATVIIRYVGDSGSIHEDFAGFVHAEDLTGEGMAHLIDFLGRMGLTLEYCRGQGYDGAAAMMGRFSDQAPTALSYYYTLLQPPLELSCVQEAREQTPLLSWQQSALPHSWCLCK